MLAGLVSLEGHEENLLQASNLTFSDFFFFFAGNTDYKGSMGRFGADGNVQ